MKNRKNKYLVESARITDAYLSMYKPVNEDAFSDKAKELEQFNNWTSKQPVAKITTVKQPTGKIASSAVKTVATVPSKAIGNAAKGITGTFIKKAEELKDFNNWASKQPVDKIKTTEEIEYPEDGDVEYTGEEEDYLTGKTDVRPKTLAPDAREKYRKTFESCHGKKNGKKVNEVADGKPHVDPVDIYTIQISRVLDNGDQEGIDEMKYAKTYYDIHDAVEDAKKAYSEYSNGDDAIEVEILAGEREHESGDIYGEPYVILTVKDGKLLDATGAEVDTTEEEFIGNIDDEVKDSDETNESYSHELGVDYDLISLDEFIDEQGIEPEDREFIKDKFFDYGFSDDEKVDVNDKNFLDAWDYAYSELLKNKKYMSNESYDDNGEVDYGDDNSMYAEDFSDDQLKNAISVIKKICAKYGAKVTGISEGDRTHAIINIKIKDPNKVPGVGFDMNRIMGIGYGIEKACEKAGINAFIAGGYIGNNTQLYLSKNNPIIESTESHVSTISPRFTKYWHEKLNGTFKPKFEIGEHVQYIGTNPDFLDMQGTVFDNTPDGQGLIEVEIDGEDGYTYKAAESQWKSIEKDR